MVHDAWLPKGYELDEYSVVTGMLHNGPEWQIYSVGDGQRLLLVLPELVAKWQQNGLITAELFSKFSINEMNLCSLLSGHNQALRPVKETSALISKTDALSFAHALRQSRQHLKNGAFHDAIYIERYSRLLPTWTKSSPTSDEVLLGSVLSGGVNISALNLERLTELSGWLKVDELKDVIQIAGFKISDADDQNPGSNNTRLKTGSTHRASKLASGEPPRKDVFSLPGRPLLENFFNEHIVDIVFNRQKYQAMGIGSPSAVILHGLPGCGKTYAVERLIEFLGWPSFSIDSSTIGSPYIHETSKKIAQVFDQAIDAAPSVLVIDEMESFLSDRNAAGSSGLHHVEEVAEFLRRIPQATEQNVLIIAMTNLIENIDPAILRRGRFDHILEIAMPSETEVSALLKSLLSKLPYADDIDLGPLIAKLTGRALSDSAFVMREAARLSARSGKTQLDQQSLDSALASLPEGTVHVSRRIGFI